MKICPVCQTRFKDKTKTCRYCNVLLETMRTSEQKTYIKHPAKKRQIGSDIIDRQTKLWKIWKVYRIPIIVIIILVAGTLLTISQRPNVSVKNIEKQIKAIESAKVYKPAVPALVTAPASNSANDLVFKALALCLSEKCTDPQKAIEYLNEAIKLKPDLVEAFNNRGNAYCDLGQYQRAIEDYNEAIRLKPDYDHFYNNRGLAYRELGQHQLAIENYNEAVRLKPDNAIVFNNRGVAYGDLGQYQRAIEDYDEAIRLKPGYAIVFNNRGNTYFMQGNKELGCRDAQKGCELGNCKVLEWAKGKEYCK
jgi:tetratricopeptide (TPR) repeat protein